MKGGAHPPSPTFGKASSTSSTPGTIETWCWFLFLASSWPATVVPFLLPSPGHTIPRTFEAGNLCRFRAFGKSAEGHAALLCQSWRARESGIERRPVSPDLGCEAGRPEWPGIPNSWRRGQPPVMTNGRRSCLATVISGSGVPDTETVHGGRGIATSGDREAGGRCLVLRSGPPRREAG